jgi:hypothetical protein
MFSQISTLCLLGLVLSSQCVSAEIMSLTDQTFEHETQASTGMTTGSWLVLFSIPSCYSCEQWKPFLEELSRDEALYERGIVLGTVDCSVNVGVCQRFSVSTLPTMLYLHKKQLYTVPSLDVLTGSNDKEEGEEVPSTVDRLKGFVLKDFATTEALPIPDAPSFMDAIMEPFTKLYEAGSKSPLLGIAILSMSSMLFLTILALVYAVVIKPKAPVKKSSKKKN